MGVSSWWIVAESQRLVFMQSNTVALFASPDFEKTLTTEAALCGCFLRELPHVSFLFVLFDLCMNSNKTLAMCRRPAVFL